ncbi:hypothetical protein V1264_017272 [Littorina saxatilis]|uniref:Uncharacterized protein n=1 Tax=Littorina saxatilis TaxID=31220 RepID=A0AAN9GF14_9CAEN
MYYLRKKFEILEVGGLQKVIKLRKNPDDGIQYLLPKSEIFDALLDAHLSTGHGGEKKMRFFIADMYDNVTQKMIAAFVSNCENQAQQGTSCPTTANQKHLRARSGGLDRDGICA